MAGRAAKVFQRLVRPRTVWSMALYVLDEPYSPGAPLPRPRRVFNSRRLRFSASYPHTQADPFLFVHEGALYLFYEVMIPNGRGRIAAWRTRDLETFEDLGVVLEQPFHLSFPFVFAHGGQVYMVPETVNAGEVALYRFADFPNGLSKHRTLLKGPFVDSHLLEHEGGWYLFTTDEARGELQLHAAENLAGEFVAHPASPITSDPRWCRSGGSVLSLGGRLYRVAQDCLSDYGANASLHEIVALSPTHYEERLAVPTLFKRDQGWDAVGAHHFSVAAFGGKTVIAADGKQNDYFINRFLGALTGR